MGYLWENQQHEASHFEFPTVLLWAESGYLKISLYNSVTFPKNSRAPHSFPVKNVDLGKSDSLILFCSSSIDYKHNVWNSDTRLCDICG